MTQEDKDLLLKDLSARLPYGVIMTNIELCETHYPLICEDLSDAMYEEDWDDVPYLRPLSSMTEEEKEELIKNFWGSHTAKDTFEELSWYLSKHFDINGLIPKGLAIEVTEDNNPYKE